MSVALSKKIKKIEKKPFLYRCIFGTFRSFYKRRKIIGLENLPLDKAIVVGNHAQAHGPLFSELYFPTKKAIWCAGEMMKAKEVPAYAYKDFWSLKPKWIRWFYKIVSFVIAPLCAFVFSNADTIGVYKDSRLMGTFKKSVNALKNGTNVIIFPEERTPYNEIVNEFQDKFVDVAKLYYALAREVISFVPMYHAPSLKTVVFGEPISYNPDLAIDEQRSVVCEHIKQEITRLARELSVHRVTPYLNVKKKHYPMSK